MIAIHTKYIPPTNSRGSRIKAYTAPWGDRKGYQVTIPYSYGAECLTDTHFEAVKALVAKHKLDWNLEGKLVIQPIASHDNRGYHHPCTIHFQA